MIFLVDAPRAISACIASGIIIAGLVMRALMASFSCTGISFLLRTI